MLLKIKGDNMSKNSCHSDSSQAHIFLNCAAPKAKIAQNCHLIRQIQNDYPPYPSGVGLYGGEKAIAESSKPIPPPRPSNLNVSVEVPPDKLKKHPGILKNYKSCPVSPVHEELEWAVVQNRATKIKFNESSTNSKRHTMYSDDARSILDMIHVDTEKMIAEITQKYGDLNDKELDVNVVGPDAELKANKYTAKKERHEHDFLSDEEINFSSDSLEDCSLDLECEKTANKKKTLCRKVHRKYEPVPPKRSVSEYFIYEDNFTFANSNRKVSLSDILNEDDNDQQRFLETQRHSSASFFLSQQYPDRKSQESILSDDFSAGGAGVSFCNSMESILSDESDCKSAPLEILFEKGKMGQRNIGAQGHQVDNNSKSYGSSPNSNNYGLDYYMQQEDKCDISNYGINGMENKSFRILGAAKSPTHHPNHHRLVCNSLSFPLFENIPLNDDFTEDFIPSLTSKAAQYSTNLSKSLSKDFANQRKSTNSNPLHGCDDLFVKKSLPEQSSSSAAKCFNRSDIFSDAATSNSTYMLKKSCSFEVDMGTSRKMPNNTKKFEQNLQRFEKDRKEQHDQHLELQKSDFNLEMDYVPHKPPAHRRSSSMKGRGKLKCKERYNTVGQISSSKTVMSFSQHSTEVRDFVNKDLLGKVRGKRYSGGEERSFEGYIAEKGVNEDDNMDSLEFIGKKYDKGVSMDSLDSIQATENFTAGKSEIEMLVDSKYITSAEYTKFRDIEKKIDIINKLVEMEERKLEQERIIKENRMKPLFDGDTTQRGFVRNLTKNFDMLTKSSQDETKNDKSCVTCKIKRNYSLPDVLEGAKYQTFEFYDEDMNFEAQTPCNESDYEEPVMQDQSGEEGVIQHQINNNISVACLFACVFSMQEILSHFIFIFIGRIVELYYD